MATRTTKIRWFLVAAITIAFAVSFVPNGNNLFHWSTLDPGEYESILVADRYIPVFTVIKPNYVHAQEFPKALVPPGAIRNKKELQNENDQMLFVSAIAIPEGQPVTRALLAGASQNESLGTLIKPGKVAISFDVDKAHGVGGWIHPGDTVAIFSAGAKKTRMLLPSVMVLAVDHQRLGQGRANSESSTDSAVAADMQPSSDAKVVTVLVTPKDAMALTEAREQGALSLVLRSLGDDFPWPHTN
jgi:pilus assembly protein CpaB